MANPDWNFISTDVSSAVQKITGGSADPKKIDWRGVRVAHIDTGVRDHPVFGGIKSANSWVKLSEGLNFIEIGKRPIEPPHASSGRLPDDGTRWISDMTAEGMDGHGTKTLSVLCGDGTFKQKKAGKTLTSRVGLLPGLPVVPYRVTDTVLLVQKPVLGNIHDAILDAIKNDCKIISMSLGFPIMRSDKLRKAVNAAYKAGVIVVGAGGQYIDKVTYPGKFQRSIGVGGHTPKRKIWHLGRYSETQVRFIDTWAPSTEIIRANPKWKSQGKMYLTEEGEGTSYGTVHVAAAAALWLRYHGENTLNKRYLEPWQRVEAFRKLLRTSSVPLLEKKGRKVTNGVGRLKISDLLAKKLPAASTLERRPKATRGDSKAARKKRS